MSEAVKGIKSEVDERVDALAEAATSAVESAAEVPGELARQVANVLSGGGEVAGKSASDFIAFVQKKIHDLTGVLEKTSQVVTGK